MKRTPSAKTKKCLVCKGPTTAKWSATGQAVCRRCAVEVLPMLFGQAILGELTVTVVAKECRKAMDKFEPKFWQGFGQAFQPKADSDEFEEDFDEDRDFDDFDDLDTVFHENDEDDECDKDKKGTKGRATSEMFGDIPPMR